MPGPIEDHVAQVLATGTSEDRHRLAGDLHAVLAELPADDVNTAAAACSARD